MTKPIKKVRQSGFTIVELMLAMAFLSFVLVFTVTSLIQVVRIYNQGLSLKQVNQSGRSIGIELQKAIQGSQSKDINVSAIDAGRLCTSGYSFVWNDPDTDNSYTEGAEELNFVRYRDLTQEMCTKDNISSNYPDVRQVNSSELLAPTLKTQSLVVTSTDNSLFKIDFTLGTSGDDLIERTGTTARCKTENPVDAQFCALSSFEVYATAKNQE